jgi:hypothetical protein
MRKLEGVEVPPATIGRCNRTTQTQLEVSARRRVHTSRIPFDEPDGMRG